MSEYKNIIEILEAAEDEESSLEQKYIFLRSAYSEIMHQVSELASIL